MILSLLRECFAEDYYNFAQTNQKVMFMVKRTILLVCLFIFPVSFSLASNDDDTLKNKIEIRGEAPSSRPHRLPAKIPFDCFYDSGLSCVVVEFISSVGEVAVDIDNMVTGEHIDATISSSQGIQAIPSPGTEGYCFITLTLSNGKRYYGEFAL